jgi:hypothetical protein
LVHEYVHVEMKLLQVGVFPARPRDHRFDLALHFERFLPRHETRVDVERARDRNARAAVGPAALDRG